MVDSIWDVFLSEEEHEYLEKKKNKAPITRATMDGELQIGDQSLHPSLSAISKEKSHSVTLTKLTSRKIIIFLYFKLCNSKIYKTNFTKFANNCGKIF